MLIKKAFQFLEGFSIIKLLENYFLAFGLVLVTFPSILSLRACKASLASPKVGFASAACS